MADGVDVGLAWLEVQLLEDGEAGNVAPIDLEDDVSLAQAITVGFALLADEADGSASVHGNNGHLERLVANGQLVSLGLIWLEEHALLEGVDDDGAVVEQFGTNMRRAFLSDRMHVAERKVTPLQTVEGKEIDGVGTLHTMHADGMLTNGTSLNLRRYLTALIDMLLETLAVHGIEMRKARVEQGTVHVPHERADPHIGHKTAELVLHLETLLLGKELLTVREYHAVVLHIKLTAKPFVDEVETDDAIVAARNGTTTSDNSQIAIDNQAAQTERGQLYHTNGVRMVVDVEGDHVAYLFYIRYAVVGEDDTLCGSRVEEKTVLLAINLDGQQEAMPVELYVDGIDEILLGNGKAQTVTVHLCRHWQTQTHRKEYGQSFFHLTA